MLVQPTSPSQQMDTSVGFYSTTTPEPKISDKVNECGKRTFQESSPEKDCRSKKRRKICPSEQFQEKGYSYRKWICPNGKYKGECIDGTRNGVGEMIFNNGVIYEGYWENDHFQGYGKVTFPDGQKYEGNWEKGKKSGFGQIVFFNGSTYVGYWKNDLAHGYGEMTFSKERIYVGDWVEGKREGRGLLVNTINNSYHVGEWVNNELVEGVHALSDGKILYEGTFRERFYYKLGTLFTGRGFKIVGKFKNNLPKGVITVFFDNGDELTYKSNGRDKRATFAIYKTREGLSYHGNFTKSRPSAGLGLIVDHDDSILLTGTWKRRRTEGQFIVSDSEVYSGTINEVLRAINLRYKNSQDPVETITIE